MQLHERIRELVQRELPSLTALRRELHQQPEVGYEEVRTAERIRKELDAAGVRHADGLAGGTGTLAHLPGGNPGDAAIALRTDIDALPMEDHGDQPWKSRVPGRAHACGHDGHTTIAIGAARVLAALAKEHPLPNPVTLLFQPAEEGGNGGDRMVKDGALDGRVLGPPVDQIYGLHGWPSLPVGTVASRPGPMLAAAEAFEIQVRGVGGHAALPHLARDPVVAASAIVQNLQSVVSRAVRPFDAAVISVTAFQAGSAFNVIPEEANLRGTIRWFHEEVGALLHERMQACVQETARALGTEASLRFLSATPVTSNAEAAVARFERVARAALGQDRVRDFGDPVMGAEDFAFYGREVPACFFALGLDRPEAPCPPLHHPTFDFRDEALATGIETMVHLAVSDRKLHAKI
jgi:amidohydrolase